MKTLKQILEVYSPKSADEKRFVKKHITIKHADVNGNGDDVFSGAAVKEIDRKKTRKGYNNADSEAVYEAKKSMSQDEKDKVVAGVQAAMRKSRGNVISGQAQLAAARLAAKIKSGTKDKMAKEEVEMNEVLKVSGGAGEWIKDFQGSDNPKFAGKSKEQRKQQALAAFYAAKRSGKE
jgi:hypothetical protein